MKHFIVERVSIIQIKGFTDLVRLHTNLPSGIVGNHYPLALEFSVAENSGPEYCKAVLGIENWPGTCPVEIIRR
jgi:hypothetical protein